MKKILLALVFAIGMAMPAMAATNCDRLVLDGMPDSAVIALKQKCVDLNTQVTAAPTDLAEYAELGKKYGIAMSEVAKSIGTTANELAQTPVGKFMLVMVAWRVMGQDLLGIIAGFFWYVTMLPLWLFMFKKLVLSTRRTVEKADTNGKIISREYAPVDYSGPLGPLTFFMGVFMIMICVAGFVMIF